MKKNRIFLNFVLVLFLAACSSTPTAPASTEVPASTPTLDLCAPENLPNEVAKMNQLMREFDDYSTLASNTPQAQLVVIIPELQRVLRESEDQVVPVCLMPLKKIQLEHMSVVVQTLLAFMGSSDPNLVNTGISQARTLHQQYDIELARLLGITLQVVTPAATSEAVASPTLVSAPIVTNPGPNEINLWSAPDFNAPVSGAMLAQATAIALGRTADNQWIQVEVPNQTGVTAWVIASVAQLSVPIEQLPITKP